MGLDMYLAARVYSSEYFPAHSKEALAAAAAADKISWPGTRNFYKDCEIKVNVAYWRKVNAVHKWFVDNVQDGEDDCRNAYVPIEKLIELRNLCAKLLESRDPEEAKELLPSQSGFFFGGTDYDEYYWSDLKDTVTQINAIVDHPDAEKFEYEYHSSW